MQLQTAYNAPLLYVLSNVIDTAHTSIDYNCAILVPGYPLAICVTSYLHPASAPVSTQSPPCLLHLWLYFAPLGSGYGRVQYRSASLSINPACEAGACTDCEYIECTITIVDGIAQ